MERWQLLELQQDEIKRLQAIASVLADNLAHYRGRTVPIVMQIAEAVVNEGEVKSDGTMFETIEQWVRLEAALEAAEVSECPNSD